MTTPPSTPSPKVKPVDIPDPGVEDDASIDDGVQQDLNPETRTPDDDGAVNPDTLLLLQRQLDGLDITCMNFDDNSTSPRNLSSSDPRRDDLGSDSEIDLDRGVTYRNGLNIVDRPLIDVARPISELRNEYQNPKFIEQIEWLEERGYHSIRRIKGDGDCFYRSFAFAFVERLFRAADTHEAIRRAIEVLDKTLPMFHAMGFDVISYADSYNMFKELILGIVGEEDGKITTQESLVKTFQDLYDSNAIVNYLRLATAAQIQLASDEYGPFLINQDIPNSEEILDPRDFNTKFVMPLGKEADNVQISALCRVFQMNVDIAYVDGRDDNRDSAQKVRFVHFRSDTDEDAEPISLLFRPGHYDILVGKRHD